MGKKDVELFKKVSGFKKIVKNDHVNVSNSNKTADGNFNQGVSKAKFKEFLKKEGEKFEKWRKL